MVEYCSCSEDFLSLGEGSSRRSLCDTEVHGTRQAASDVSVLDHCS